MSDKEITEQTVTPKPAKVKSSECPCKKCGMIKGRSGWYCPPCREIAEKERHKRSGAKPHYKKKNCSDCDGVRDRPKGYLCSVCYEARKNLRKEIIRDHKEEIKEKIKMAIKDKQEKINQKE